MENTEQGKANALLPVAVFLLVFWGSGIAAGDFYSMPAIVSFLLALTAAFLQNRKVNFEKKIKIVAKGVGDENIIAMCLIFLAAGAFSGAVKMAGGAENTVLLGLSVLPSNAVGVGLLVISCFISISMGTSMGTIAALTPIALEISQKTGLSVAVCVGAVLCGAMFGDNLSIISDTTIAAVKTQGCTMRDKFQENLLIVLPAAAATIFLFFALTNHAEYAKEQFGSYNIWLVLPYFAVLIGALCGFSVFGILIMGTILSLTAGIVSGEMEVGAVFSAVGDGVEGMYEITVISLVVTCIVALVRANGGILFLLSWIKKRIRGKRGGELGIALLALLVDLCTANNTIAIVTAGPIAKEISEEFGIAPKRSASVLDIFTSAAQGMIPYGAQLLTAASLTALTPFEIIPYCFYPFFTGISGIFFILFVNSRRTETKRTIQNTGNKMEK